MDNDDSAMLHNKAIIASNLSMLAKHKCMISANLEGSESFLTAIISVNYKEGTAILDYGASEHLNRKLVIVSHVDFSTVFNGIQVAFTTGKITKIKHEGQDAFLMQIPESMYWFNRREYYRVNTPVMNPSVCSFALTKPDEDATEHHKNEYFVTIRVIKELLFAQLELDLAKEKEEFEKAYAKMSIDSKIKAKLQRQKLEEDRKINPPQPDEQLFNVLSLPLHDISLSGFSLLNTREEFSPFLIRGTAYNNVKIQLPDFGDIAVSFEIVVRRKIESHKIKGFGELIGAKFVGIKASAESKVLHYIQEIERQNSMLTL